MAEDSRNTATDISDLIVSGDLGAARELIDFSSVDSLTTPEGLTVLFFAERYGFAELAEHLREKGLEHSILDLVLLGELELLRKALEIAPNAVNRRNSDGRTALFWAGDVDVAVELINRGADVNEIDQIGETPLHDAAGYGSLQVVKVLIEHGGDVNARSVLGETPLFEAALIGDREKAEMLLRAGADKSIRARSGMSAADVANSRGFPDLANIIGSWK
jgi:ankyrin repeat protein